MYIFLNVLYMFRLLLTYLSTILLLDKEKFVALARQLDETVHDLERDLNQAETSLEERRCAKGRCGE